MGQGEIRDQLVGKERIEHRSRPMMGHKSFSCLTSDGLSSLPSLTKRRETGDIRGVLSTEEQAGPLARGRGFLLEDLDW